MAKLSSHCRISGVVVGSTASSKHSRTRRLTRRASPISLKNMALCRTPGVLNVLLTAPTAMTNLSYGISKVSPCSHLRASVMGRKFVVSGPSSWSLSSSCVRGDSVTPLFTTVASHSIVFFLKSTARAAAWIKSTFACGSRTGSTMLEKSSPPLAASVNSGVKTK